MIRVGLTFDLRQTYLEQGYGLEETAEFDRAETIDALAQAIESLGYAADRVGNAFQLMAALSGGRRWDLVFNIAEGLYGFGRESLVPALLDAHKIPYVFSDPLAAALTLHKGMAKRVIRDLGLATPDFAVVEDLRDLDGLDLPYPLFAKPVAEGTGKGVTAASRIQNPEQLARVCGELLAVHHQPVLVETYLPGREFTVGVLGTGRDASALPVMEVLLRPDADQGAYTYTNKEECESLVDYVLAFDPQAQAAAELAVACHRGLGLRDASRVDIRLDAAGKPGFMEVNPLAGMHPEHSDLPIMCTLAGISYKDLVSRIMASALARLKDPAQQAHAAAGPARTAQPILLQSPAA